MRASMVAGPMRLTACTCSADLQNSDPAWRSSEQHQVQGVQKAVQSRAL
jgi:hypothetical protein